LETRNQNKSKLIAIASTMKFFLRPITFALFCVSHAHANGLRALAPGGNGNGQGNPPPLGGNGNGDGAPEFITDVPPGLVNNPSETKKAIIRGLDNKPIQLDIDKADRLNIFHPDKFTPSQDGTYVISNENGEVFKLNAFYISDEKNGVDITFALDEDDRLMNVRVTPKVKAEREPTPEQAQRTQNFQHLENTDLLVGYSDDDMELSTEVIGDGDKTGGENDIELPDDLSEIFDAPPEGSGRRMQQTNTAYAYGVTCTRWDYLTVRIVTDKKFKERYPDHKSRAQAIFAEAQEIYWKESCVWLYMYGYENSDGNSLWNWGSGWNLDNILGYYGSNLDCGCNSDYGALDWFERIVKRNQYNEYRDAWHLFSGAPFSGSCIGCAYTNVCQSKEAGFGANEITFTTNLRKQAVLFAHELGHNLGLSHLGSTDGYWVMEPAINSAPWDLTNSNAAVVENRVVFSSSCGWN